MELPIGSIVIWGSETIPAGYHLCDGTSGTPDLRGFFIRGASSSSSLLLSGGASTHVHSNVSTGTYSSHAHSISGSTDGSIDNKNTALYGSSQAVRASHTHSYSGTTSSEYSHSHTVGNTWASSNMPPHIKLYFIMRLT